jgi:hypothetical protein
MTIINYILLFIILILLYIIKLFIPNKINKTCKDFQLYKRILLQNMLKDVKPGDLLLFSSNNYSIITRTFGNSTFSHIALVISIDNKLHTLEMVNDDFVYPGNNRNQGIITIPLEDRIQYYNGQVYLASLIKPLDKNQLQILNSYKDKNYTFLNKKNIIYLFNAKNKFLGNERFCSEFISEILYNINISSIPHYSSKFKLQTEIINLCNNIIYKNPINIIHEKTLINDINENYQPLNYC